MAIETATGNVRKNYGVPVTAYNKVPAAESNRGIFRELIYTFSYDDVPDSSTTDALTLVLPANAFVISARLGVKVAFAGGTSLAVGLEKYSDGTAVDADGLITDANAPLASINAVGKWVVGTGALIAVGAGADATQVAITKTGTFTAGVGKLIVTYIPLL